MSIFQSPSDQFIKAVDHCRKEFADTKGVTRNAIDQRFAGNTLDPYPPFRSEFKDVCATRDADCDVYINDMLAIKAQFRPPLTKSVVEAFTCNLGKAHDLIETCAEALQDGHADKEDCRRILTALGALEDEMRGLKESVMKQWNLVNGSILPNEILEKANGRRGR